jgi:hypothetical protein
VSPDQDAASIAQEIARHSVETGRALARSYAKNFSNRFEELDLQVVDYIFVHAATDMLHRFSQLNDAERLTLRNRAIRTIKAAFEERLAELCQVVD